MWSERTQEANNNIIDMENKDIVVKYDDVVGCGDTAP